MQHDLSAVGKCMGSMRSIMPAMTSNGCWLVQGAEQMPGVYIPQQGDQVVYLTQGHKRYLERTNDKRLGPWQSLVSTAVRLSMLRFSQPWLSLLLAAPSFPITGITCPTH